MDEMSDFDRGFQLGFAVGLYEGEGTINLSRDKRRGGRPYARLKVRMTDREPLERMKEYMGGFVTGPYSSPKEAVAGYKPKYRWEVATIDGLQRVARMLVPHLSPRRQVQINAVLDLIRQSPTDFPAAKRFGQLVCPPVVIASVRGYQRHRLLGIPPCQICLDSAALYAKEFRGRHPEKRERKASYMREWRMRHLDEIRVREKEWRAKRQAISLSGNQPATSPDAAPLSPVGS